MKRVATVLTLAIGLVAVMPILARSNSADAYCTSGISRWTSSSYTLAVSYKVPSSWNTSVNNSRKQWDDSHINIYHPWNSTLNYYYPIFNAPFTGSWYMGYETFASLGLPDTAPGATWNSSNSSNHSWSKMYFNSTWTWNFSGVLNQSQKKADVHTVVMHEMGHSSGLNHPSVCGTMTQSEVASAMNVTWTKKWSINSDDAYGIHSLY